MFFYLNTKYIITKEVKERVITRAQFVVFYNKILVLNFIKENKICNKEKPLEE